MPRTFARDESIEEGSRRLAREGVWSAIAALEDRARDPEEAVHDARKALKRTRALVRLLRGAIGRRAARTANATLRDTGQLLSASRDATVVRQTFEELVAERPPPEVDAIRAALVRSLETSGDDTKHRDRALAALHAFVPTIDQWTFEAEGWAALADGLSRIHRGGRVVIRAITKSAEAEAVHDLRKRGKDLQFSLDHLQPIWPDAIDAYRSALHDLADLLGDDHDLFVLGERLAAIGERSLDERIEARRAQLLGKARPLIARIWAEPTGAFVERLGAWYDAWSR
jgi:CHAD domain-containing protein